MADPISDIYLLLTEEKKKTEELEVLIKDLRMENAALRTENDHLRSTSIPKGNDNNHEFTI